MVLNKPKEKVVVTHKTTDCGSCPNYGIFSSSTRASSVEGEKLDEEEPVVAVVEDEEPPAMAAAQDQEQPNILLLYIKISPVTFTPQNCIPFAPEFHNLVTPSSAAAFHRSQLLQPPSS